MASSESCVRVVHADIVTGFLPKKKIFFLTSVRTIFDVTRNYFEKYFMIFQKRKQRRTETNTSKIIKRSKKVLKNIQIFLVFQKEICL